MAGRPGGAGARTIAADQPRLRERLRDRLRERLRDLWDTGAWIRMVGFMIFTSFR